jgi:hypothetical protein
MPVSPTFAVIRLRNKASFARIRNYRSSMPALAARRADVR